MKAKFTLITALTAIILAGCSANSASDGRKTGDEQVYTQRGMEVSKVASAMADTLEKTLKRDIIRETLDKTGKSVDEEKLSFPRVAVISFVDTDTYENAGHLGRQLGEFFIHELDRRGIPVVEFKTTGSISVSKDGEVIFSRDWKKLASQARIQHVLAGTISRNDSGVVLVGRIIDMASSDVKGSATGFVPYKYLPYCYRTAEKNCSFEGVLSYSTYVPADGGKTTSKNGTAGTGTAVTTTSSATYSNSPYVSGTKEPAQERKARQKLQHDPEFNEKYYPTGAKVPATSTGNYEWFIHDHGQSFGGKSTVVYPADTYRYQGQIVRDVHDQSQYQRVENN